METIASIVSIFGWSFFSFWSAIPAGLALGVAPVVVIIVVTVSYASGVLVVLLPGERVRIWLMKRYEDRLQSSENPGALRRIWTQYGVIGLGLLGPMTVGAQIGALLGLSMETTPKKLFLWMTLGALGWSVILTVAFALGIEGVEQLLGSP